MLLLHQVHLILVPQSKIKYQTLLPLRKELAQEENHLRNRNSQHKVRPETLPALVTSSNLFSGRKSFVYEQISDKNKTSLLKSQFTKKATVKVTTTSVSFPSLPLPCSEDS
jgi:hypothetical protein